MRDYTSDLKVISKANEEGRYSDALELLLPLCEKNVPSALGILGTMYQLAHGVAFDGNKALELLITAFEMGDGNAAHNLGTVYISNLPGIGVNKKLSKFYYRKAKELGCQYAPDEFYQ